MVFDGYPGCSDSFGVLFTGNNRIRHLGFIYPFQSTHSINKIKLF